MAMDRVHMRGPRQLICKSDTKTLGYLDNIDQFGKMLGAFVFPTLLHFNVICFTDYRVIAEKPRIGHLPQFFLCTL